MLNRKFEWNNIELYNESSKDGDNLVCDEYNIEKFHIGHGKEIKTGYGIKPLIYADWAASGRYHSAVERFIERFRKIYGNTHNLTGHCGKLCSYLKEESRNIIKNHWNLNYDKEVIFYGNGSTACINKFARILENSEFLMNKREYWYCNTYRNQLECIICKSLHSNQNEFMVHTNSVSHIKIYNQINGKYKDLKKNVLILISEFEHHSNELIWRELTQKYTFIKLVKLEFVENSTSIDINQYKNLINETNYSLIISSFNMCSNVTGSFINYNEIISESKNLKKEGIPLVLAFDMAQAGPYMFLEKDQSDCIDAMFLSTHKFYGGPGGSGILIVSQKLMQNSVPTVPGGGTVFWVDPEDRQYLASNSEREEGGTANTESIIRAAMAHRFKHKYQTIIHKFEQTVNTLIHDQLSGYQTQADGHHIQIVDVSKLISLNGNASNENKKLGLLSFLIQIDENEVLHPLLVSSLLSDMFGIECRSGCNCVGPYTQKLLGIIDYKSYLESLKASEESLRPAVTRVSFHYSMSSSTLKYIVDSIQFVAKYGIRLMKDYKLDSVTGEFKHIKFNIESITLKISDFNSDSFKTNDYDENCYKDLESYYSKIKYENLSYVQNLKPHNNKNEYYTSRKYDHLRYYYLPNKKSNQILFKNLKRKRSNNNLINIDYLKDNKDSKEILKENEYMKKIDKNRYNKDKNSLEKSYCIKLSKFYIKKWDMLKISDNIRRSVGAAISEFEMIKENDKILIGISGGKDSLTLLHCLRYYQRISPTRFTIAAVTVDPVTSEYDPSPLIDYMKSLNITYYYIRKPLITYAKDFIQKKLEYNEKDFKIEYIKDKSEITNITSEVCTDCNNMSSDNKNEKGFSICSWCSRLKRGLIYQCMRENNYNVLALGQHLDDICESFLMSVFRNGCLRTMSANYIVDTGDLRVIRPLVYTREKLLREYSVDASLPVISENCPACFQSPKERARVKNLLSSQESIHSTVFSCMKNALMPLLKNKNFDEQGKGTNINNF